MDHKIRWGILATGSIADTFARDLKHSHHGTLAGVASRTPARAQEFCDMHGGTTCEDPPGEREGSGVYLAYLRDPDGNKLCILHRLAK